MSGGGWEVTRAAWVRNWNTYSFYSYSNCIDSFIGTPDIYRCGDDSNFSFLWRVLELEAAFTMLNLFFKKYKKRIGESIWTTDFYEFQRIFKFKSTSRQCQAPKMALHHDNRLFSIIATRMYELLTLRCNVEWWRNARSFPSSRQRWLYT